MKETDSVILKEVVADDVVPVCSGRITFYPASSLSRIFDWAEERGRKLEWVEGLFHKPGVQGGLLTLSYICERRDAEYSAFRDKCLSLVESIKAEAAEKGMNAYFEIGIST